MIRAAVRARAHLVREDPPVEQRARWGCGPRFRPSRAHARHPVAKSQGGRRVPQYCAGVWVIGVGGRATLNLAWATTASTLALQPGGGTTTFSCGTVVGSPTGGSHGAGTINLRETAAGRRGRLHLRLVLDRRHAGRGVAQEAQTCPQMTDGESGSNRFRRFACLDRIATNGARQLPGTGSAASRFPFLIPPPAPR